MSIKKKIITATLAAGLMVSPTAALAEGGYLEDLCNRDARSLDERFIQYFFC